MLLYKKQRHHGPIHRTWSSLARSGKPHSDSRRDLPVCHQFIQPLTKLARLLPLAIHPNAVHSTKPSGLKQSGAWPALVINKQFFYQRRRDVIGWRIFTPFKHILSRVLTLIHTRHRDASICLPATPPGRPLVGFEQDQLPVCFFHPITRDMDTTAIVSPTFLSASCPSPPGPR